MNWKEFVYPEIVFVCVSWCLSVSFFGLGLLQKRFRRELRKDPIN